MISRLAQQCRPTRPRSKSPTTKSPFSLYRKDPNSTIIISFKNKVLKPGPDRTVRPKKPWTAQFCDFFSFKNCSMGKRQRAVRTVRFWELWPVFEVPTVSFCFNFSDEFWVHRYEVMIRSRRNEKEMKEHEEEQRSEGGLIIFGGA